MPKSYGSPLGLRFLSKRISLVFASVWLGVFLKNKEIRSTEGILLKASPAQTARTKGLFLSSKTRSVKL